MPDFDALSLAEWTGGRWKPDPPSKIRGISTDTRTLSPGSLFVALKGKNFDGHDYLRQGFEKGAAGAVISRRDNALKSYGPLLFVDDTAEALINMAAGRRRALGAQVIAVTGSMGKTTVKEMTADVMSIRGATARTAGNWNNEIGLPLSILGMDESERTGVFEVGMSRPGELKPLCEILAPNWGVITAIAPVHMEYFDSVRGIALEKSALFESLPRDGTAVLRRDQEWFDLLCARAPCRIVTVGMSGEADYMCDYQGEYESRMRISERSSGESFEFKLPLPGRHFAENALFAIAVGREHGIDWKSIAQAVGSFKTQPMRWECSEIQGVLVINDAYNANPVSMAAAIKTFAGMPDVSRKWLVLGGMRELGSAEEQGHAEIGTLVGMGQWAGLITVGALGAKIAEALGDEGCDSNRVFTCACHASAARVLHKVTGTGDAVLLKASRGECLERVLSEWERMG